MEGGRHRQIETAQVAGVDLVVENPLKAGLAFAAPQATFGRTTPAGTRRLRSRRWAALLL